MIFVISGNDSKKRISIREKIIKESTSGNALVSRIGESEFSPEAVSGLVYEKPMFFEERISILSDVLSENIDFFKDILEDMSSSENIFIFEEESVSSSVSKTISKYAKEVFKAEKALEKKPQSLGFAWAGAVLNKDKKNAWLLLEKATSSGSSAEELSGTLFWQIKTVILVKTYENDPKTLASSGIAPYSVSQAKSFSKNWTLEELHKMSSELISSSLESRRKGIDSKTALEEFVLRVLN